MSEDSSLDELVHEFHRIEAIETTLLISRNTADIWPKPSSSELWYNGLALYGMQFSLREYELRDKG
jgi:hypothetical protein